MNASFSTAALLYLTLVASLATAAPQAGLEKKLISQEGSDALRAVRDKQGSIDGLNKLFTDVTHKNGLPYHVYVPPGLKANQAYPLVMFLHGNTDLTIGTHKGFPKGVWTLPEVQKAHPHIVFVPRHQVHTNRWTDAPYHALTIKALDDLIADHNADPAKPDIDTKRLYVTGFSKGGAGTWYFIQQNPDKFAAAVPLAGARQGPTTAEGAKSLKHIPIWIFNGDPPERSAASHTSYAVLKEAGAKSLKFHEYAHRGHVIDDFAYFTPGFFDWLFSQHKP